MKIAISSTGPGLDAQVDPRFGRCQCFIVVDPATGAFDVWDNSAAAITGGAGIQAAQLIGNGEIDVVLTGSLGPNAREVLSAAGVKVGLGVSGTVRDALGQYENGQLQTASGSPAETPSGPGGFGGGAAPGSIRGMGRGTGRGMGGRRGGGGRCGWAGPAGHCICSSCGVCVPHQAGVPCFEQKCPQCGGAMRGEA